MLVAQCAMLAGCGDHSETSPSNTSPNPTTPAAASPPDQAPVAPAAARQLSTPELERYRIELQKLMPDKRVDRVGSAQPGGPDILRLTGFDSVIIAKRGASGKTEQVCVDNRDRAMEFLSAPPKQPRSAETE